MRRPPRLCACNLRIAAGEQCPCERRREAARQAARPTANARGYTSKWQREAAAYLQIFRKCKRCGDPSGVVDHIIPHRGDHKLFWSRSNWQPMCRSCHSSAKQIEERGRGRGSM